MPYTAVRLCQVYQWLSGCSKNDTFHAYTANKTLRRTTKYIIFMHVSVIFHCVHTENAIFAPTAGRLETPITALYCISGEKLLGHIYFRGSPMVIRLTCDCCGG